MTDRAIYLVVSWKFFEIKLTECFDWYLYIVYFYMKKKVAFYWNWELHIISVMVVPISLKSCTQSHNCNWRPKEKTQGVNLIKIKKCLFHSQAVQKQLDVVISLFLFQRLATVWAVLRQAGDVTHHTSTSQMMANLDISFRWSCSPWWKNAAGIASTPIKQSLTLEQTAKTSHQRKTPAANF